MVTVIYLKDRLPSARRSQATTREDFKGSAQILLFTGVRYEHYTPETRPTSTGSKRARKR